MQRGEPSLADSRFRRNLGFELGFRDRDGRQINGSLLVRVATSAGPGGRVLRRSIRRCQLGSPRIAHAPRDVVPLPAGSLGISLPSCCDIIWEGVVEISHRFKSILPTRSGDKPGDLLMVSLDHNFLPLRHDAVEHAAEIAGQFCCADRFHFYNRYNLMISDNTYLAEP